ASPTATTAVAMTSLRALCTASLLFREGFEARLRTGLLTRGSWRPSHLPIRATRTVAPGTAERDGAPHSQWRDRAGLGAATASPASLTRIPPHAPAGSPPPPRVGVATSMRRHADGTDRSATSAG